MSAISYRMSDCLEERIRQCVLQAKDSLSSSGQGPGLIFFSLRSQRLGFSPKGLCADEKADALSERS